MGTIYVYHHNDHDGIVAAAILYRRYRKEKNMVFNMIDYTVDLNFDHIDFDKGDTAVFLDYSFTNEGNMNRFKDLLSRRNSIDDVTWIDHHVSSLGVFDNTVRGVRNSALCATAWTYLWYTFTSGKEVIKQLLLMSDKDISDRFHTSPDLPLFIKLIDDYDCWKHIYDETNNFHYGLTISDPKDITLANLIDGWNGNRDYYYNLMRSIRNNGESTRKYLELDDKNYHVDMYGFEHNLHMVHLDDRSKDRIIKCFCLNRKGNSLMFGDKIDEYDAVIPFYFNGSKWTYSIFTNKDYVDCEKIAKCYGGGGHRKAAGWTSDRLFFSK